MKPLLEGKPDVGLEARYEQMIRAAISEEVVRIVRILAPLNTGDDVEVLFLSGPVGDLEPSTALIEDGASERILIRSGW